LEEVCKAFAIFGDKEKAIKLTLTRFDASTKEAFFNLYTKIDPTILPIPEGMKDAPAKSPTAEQQKIAALKAELERMANSQTIVSDEDSDDDTQYALNA
jgi:hypothetical protein